MYDPTQTPFGAFPQQPVPSGGLPQSVPPAGAPWGHPSLNLLQQAQQQQQQHGQAFLQLQEQQMMALIRQQQLQQHATGLIGHASLMSGQTLLMPHSTASSSSSSTSSAAPMDNDEIVGRALKLLHGALSVFAGKMLQRCLGDQWVSAVRDRLRQAQPMTFVSTTFGPVMQEIDRKRQELAAEKETELGEKAREQDQLDLRDLLQCITRMWDVFRNVLKPGVRSFCFELMGVRNNWAHQDLFSIEDTYRALDTVERVLMAIGATKEAQTIRRDREGYTIYMAERFKQQGASALPVKESSSSSADWCGRDARRSTSSPAVERSRPRIQPSPSFGGPAAPKDEAADLGMDWEL